MFKSRIWVIRQSGKPGLGYPDIRRPGTDLFVPDSRFSGSPSPGSPDRRIAAFTLIEVITATAIAGILLTALGSLLMGSFQIATILDSRKEAVLEKALIALESMALDIQKVPVYRSTPMEGRSGGISFYQLVSNTNVDPYQKAFRLGQVQNVTLSGTAIWMKKVEYSFDAGQKALLRKTESGNEKVLADHLSGARFFYAIDTTVDANDPSWEWRDKFSGAEGENKLKAIRVVLELDKESLRYAVPSVEKTFLVLRDQSKQ